LTAYSSKTQTEYCRGIPGNVLESLKASQHLVREVSHVRSFEEVSDALASGYGVNSCGGEGWEKTRNEHAFSRQSGSWAHSIAVIGADDTEWAHQNYGGPLICLQNSWSAWNRGPRHTHGDSSLPEVPIGGWWTTWKEASRRTYQVLSNVAGFPPRKIRDWNISESGLI
jgi:aminoglycoside phosphotransferase (APT) family kinase protein